ncbi:nuclear inhibitor of protein phosphatase 1 [Exaiptasia diaphana]|uniref:Nuclear inhibitor of protein phosphatase 1 n=1 Tax=Exaiptasia diaphana TaxID=2652724 RepID=A0A913Y973_EXADI|nr:nuclear inhibitor of protein phosphatase 1 [Exaiptasia diaphana]KXJ21219.1 Nuclear inhibitor of protein phosphatase 1 [Exaiptasia diaphana]
MADVNEKTTPVKKGPYEIPSWAGKPPQGLHLDVMKTDKLVEKLIIDEKSCYLFGRNKDTCDFSLEHTSCSRVHAALVFHRHLKRCFLVDLGSTHGTFIGTIRIEKQKPTQVQVDSVIRFGASTRSYTLREKPTGSSKGEKDMGDENEENNQAGLLGLPESDTELDDLTEFNTAHNKRLALAGLDESSGNLGTMSKLSRKRKSSNNVSFKDSEEIINPEDVDPSIGKFRNMIHTSVVVPNKKIRVSGTGSGSMTDSITRRLQSFPYSQGLYANLPGTGGDQPTSPTSPTSPTASLPKLNITSAPEVESPTMQHIHMAPELFHPKTAAFIPNMQSEAPKKKKYAKEAWPGKKPTPSLLI